MKKLYKRTYAIITFGNTTQKCQDIAFDLSYISIYVSCKFLFTITYFLLHTYDYDYKFVTGSMKIVYYKNLLCLLVWYHFH